MNATQRLRGIVPPLVTPLLDRDTIDEPGTRRLVDHAIDGGVCALFILGTTGEGPSLSYALRRRYIQLVTEITDDRVPILVGITDTSFVESVHMACAAADAGAHSVVLTTPYYFPAGQTELIQYIRRIVAELPLPLMLYNMPRMTKVWFEIESIKQLAQYPQIIGVKDSSGDLDYFERLCELKQIRSDWSVLIGPEAMLVESIALGGDGGVPGGANLFPKLLVDLYDAAVSGDEAKVALLQGQVEKLGQIYTIGKYASRFIKSIKSALSLQEICNDQLAEPFTHFLPPERERVREVLVSLNEDLVGAKILASTS